MASNEKNYIDLICFRIPRANRIIRVFFLKQWRKRANKEWKSTPDEGKAFATGVGRRAWTTSSCRQKTLLECGDIYLWDLGLYNHVLQKTDFGVNGLGKREKTLLNDLAMLQNDIHRNYKPTMTKDEHESKTKQIEHILKQFEPPIEDVLNGLKLTDEQNGFTAHRLKELANSLFKEKKYQDALRCYNQAIETSEISNQLLGELYSNRSAVYSMIAGGKDTAGSALENAKRAVQLLPEWFRGYYRLGCAYRLLEVHEEAFKYFSVALELQPDKTDIIPLRDECEKKIPKPKSPREILLGNEIRNVQDLADSINTTCGTRMTSDGLTEILNSGNKNLPEFCLVKAIYLMGFGEPPNYNEIFVLLWRAAEKSTMALFYIANMYELGVGVERDVKKSIKLIKRVATSRKSSDSTINCGVAVAQNFLGVMYEKGIGFPIDFEESVRFYQRSCDNGSRLGASNLGLLYLSGTGVECNEKKGVKYLKLAAKRFNVFAPWLLVNYYLVNAQDADQAMEWYRRAVSYGDLDAISKLNEVEAAVRALKSKFEKMDEDVRNWEGVSGLAADDLSMKRRRERYLKNCSPGSGKLHDTISKIIDGENKHYFPISRQVFNFDIKVLDEFAKKGSVTARDIKKGLVHSDLAEELFKRGFMDKCIHHLAEGICITECVVDGNFCRQVVADCKKMGVEVNEIPSSFNRDLRVCFTLNYRVCIERNSEFLEECVRIFPDFVWFRRSLASEHVFWGDTAKALIVVNCALEKFPNDFHLWFLKVVIIFKIADGNKKGLMLACDKYLALAPTDARNRPRIYYIMGIVASDNERDKYYKLGLEAEKFQLPCFLPFDCAEKTLLESLIGCLFPQSEV